MKCGCRLTFGAGFFTAANTPREHSPVRNNYANCFNASPATHTRPGVCLCAANNKKRARTSAGCLFNCKAFQHIKERAGHLRNCYSVVRCSLTTLIKAIRTRASALCVKRRTPVRVFYNLAHFISSVHFAKTQFSTQESSACALFVAVEISKALPNYC
jgi:hypothetical protein